MDPRKLASSGTPKKLAGFVARLRESMAHGNGKHSTASVREDEHNGHHIRIHTIYQVEVDGRRIQLPLTVDNEGHVHCHSLPNYQFASAMDMVKTLIDNFPEDFAHQKRPATGFRAHRRPLKRKKKRGAK